MVSIAKAKRIRAKWLSESRIRAAETRKRRSEAAAAVRAPDGGGGSDQVEHWSMISYVIS
jgi:hypothetical protein